MVSFNSAPNSHLFSRGPFMKSCPKVAPNICADSFISLSPGVFVRWRVLQFVKERIFYDNEPQWLRPFGLLLIACSVVFEKEPNDSFTLGLGLGLDSHTH